MLDSPRRAPFGAFGGRGMMLGRSPDGHDRMFAEAAPMAAAAISMDAAERPVLKRSIGNPAEVERRSRASGDGSDGPAQRPDVALDGVPVRKNLNETAFFFRMYWPAKTA